MALKATTVQPDVVAPADASKEAKPKPKVNNTTMSMSCLVRWFGALSEGGKPSLGGGGIRRKEPTTTSRGVYYDLAPPMDDGEKHGHTSAANYNAWQSQKTIDSRGSFDSAASSEPGHSAAAAASCYAPVAASWAPTNELGHLRGVPLVVRRPQYESFDEGDDQELLKKIMKKASRLPLTSGKYASNHIMINSERFKRSIPPLTRHASLDRIARDHAESMARSNQLFHTEDPLLLQERILCEAEGIEQTIGRIGENTVRGRTIPDIHEAMMVSLAERNNILDKRYSSMGVGTGRAHNGTLYLCQIFTG
jgi:uncharacterized protein YkwD